jgi:hypothetical protein
LKFIVAKYNKESSNNFCCRVEVADSPREEKDIKNIKEKPPEEVARYDDSVNTNRAKDRAFRATHENFKINVMIK